MSHSLVLKMLCASAAEDGCTNEQVVLDAVHSDDPGDPNKQWTTWTPMAHLTIAINNPAAKGVVKPGKQYMVTLTECED